MPALRELTAEEISCLAGIITKLRPYGAPRWQAPGVRATFVKVAHLDAADALMAALRLSQDRSAETPAQIAITSSECWREKVGDQVHTHKPYVAQQTCDICGFAKSDCEMRWAGDHEFTPVPRGRDRRLPKDEAVEVVTELKNHLQPLGQRPEPRDLVAEADEIRKQAQG